jgi:hypothetical protein
LLQNPDRPIILRQQIHHCLVINHGASFSVNFVRIFNILLDLGSQPNSMKMQNIKESRWSYPTGSVLIDILEKRF